MEQGRAKWIDDIFFFDNLKFIAIFFVCFNHLSWDATNNATVFALRLGVPFAIPLFAFASGYSQKNFESKSFFSKTFSIYLAANLIFIPWTFYYYWMKHDQVRSTLDLLVGPSALVIWYFLALIVWKMATPFVMHFRWPVTSSVVVAIGLYAVSESLIRPGPSGTENEVLSMFLRGIIRLYPFYLLGVLVTREQIFRLRRWRHKYLLILPAAAGFYACGSGLLLNTPSAHSFWQAGGYLAASAACSAAVMAFTPGKSYKYFTSLGQKTLGIYLFHEPASRILFKLLAVPVMATHIFTNAPYLYNAAAETLLFAVVAYIACVLAARRFLMTWFNALARRIELLLFDSAVTGKL